MSSPIQPGLTERLSLRLRCGQAAASNARGALSRLRGDIDEPLMETLRLLVTELVTNSVRHADADAVSLRILVTGTSIWTEVSDEGPGFDPRLTGVPQRDRSGWGLFLVERLAHRWGVIQDGDTTRVWFELLRD